jgi:hypothetical protein
MAKRIIFALVVEITCLGFAGFVQAVADDAEKKSSPIASFQVPKHGDMIVLPVTIGKKNYLFWLDTGASVDLLDKSLKGELGNYRDTQVVETAKDRVALESYEPPPMRLGTVSLPIEHGVGACDLGEMRKVSGWDIYGVLGMDSLKHYVVQIDFDDGELRLYPPNTKDGGWGESFPIYANRGGIPEIKMIFDDVPFTFMVDTGCSGLHVEDHLFRWLDNNNEILFSGKSQCCTTFGQKTERKTWVMDRLCAGSFERRKIICVEGNENRLGLSYLSRFQVTFDFPNGTLILKKGKGYDDIEHDDMAGLHMLREGKNTVVEIVDPDSPAELAGIQPGDNILRVDDRNASQIGMFDLKNIFRSGDGKKLRLRISRKDNDLEKILVLKEKIPQPIETVKK